MHMHKVYGQSPIVISIDTSKFEHLIYFKCFIYKLIILADFFLYIVLVNINTSKYLWDSFRFTVTNDFSIVGKAFPLTIAEPCLEPLQLPKINIITYIILII